MEKVPLGRKEAMPLSPTSMASSSSTSPSRSKDAPTVCVTHLGPVLVSLQPRLGSQGGQTWVPLPLNPWGKVLEEQGGAPAPSDLSSNPLPQTLKRWVGWAVIEGELTGTPWQGHGAVATSPFCSWQVEKAGTPSLKSSTPTSQGDTLPGSSSAQQFRPTAAKVPVDPLGELGTPGAWVRLQVLSPEPHPFTLPLPHQPWA